MSHRSSDEEVGRQILGFFVRYRIPAGGILQRNNFFDVRDGDFQRGIDKAIANNWITVGLRNRYRYQLTATGYAAGQIIDLPLDTPINRAGPSKSELDQNPNVSSTLAPPVPPGADIRS
jgi:hypothetical protein